MILIMAPTVVAAAAVEVEVVGEEVAQEVEEVEAEGAMEAQSLAEVEEWTAMQRRIHWPRLQLLPHRSSAYLKMMSTML
jgi:hypothetical protein